MAQLDTGSSTAGKANVDSNYNLNVNLPTTNTQAGFAQLTAVPSSTIPPNNAFVSDDNALYTAGARQVLDLDFNSASTAWASKFGTNATTMTKAVQNGFMRLNNSAITTTTTGISIYSNRVVTIEAGYDYRFKAQVKHANMTATNKQVDIGMGYYGFAAGQAAAMNEFIGFRWTTTGGLQIVVETSQGGAPTSQTTNINSNVPYSDNVSREYEFIANSVEVVFFVDEVFVGRIVKDPASWGLLKSASLPFIARIFNSGAASAATTVDVGMVSIIKLGADDDMPHAFRMSAMDKASYYGQPDILAAATSPHSFPASGTAPTGNVGSNTASAANNTALLGGIIRNTLTGVSATLSTNVLWIAYQNPANPTAAGVATNARNFYVTGITISPMVVTTALTGGGFTAGWFAAIGATATSLATADADGTTAVAQKAPRIVPLSLVSTLAATAALGVVSTDVGDHQFQFPTPLVVHPGEFLHIGFRTIAVTALISAGSADCLIGVNGYWD
jgi:hypothetical protein